MCIYAIVTISKADNQQGKQMDKYEGSNDCEIDRLIADLLNQRNNAGTRQLATLAKKAGGLYALDAAKARATLFA